MRWLAVLITVTGSTPAVQASGPPPRIAIAVDPMAVVRERVASGVVTAECTAHGTKLRFDLEGLVPPGTYTLWIFAFGVTGDALDPADATAAGALGNGDGRTHEFVADVGGRAALVPLQPRGRLSAFGALGGCLLGTPQWRVLGAYHPRGVVAGTSGPPEGEAIVHFGVRANGTVRIAVR